MTDIENQDIEDQIEDRIKSSLRDALADVRRLEYLSGVGTMAVDSMALDDQVGGTIFSPAGVAFEIQFELLPDGMLRLVAEWNPGQAEELEDVVVAAKAVWQGAFDREDGLSFSLKDAASAMETFIVR